MRKHIPIVVSLVLLVILVYLDLNQPKPVDWTATYSRSDNNPYGAEVLYELLSDIFPSQRIQATSQDIYGTLNAFDDTHEPVNYLFIADKLAFNPIDVEKLLDFVQKGNQVFLAAEDISGVITDSLGIAFEMGWQYYFNKSTLDSTLHFTHPQLTDSVCVFKKSSIVIRSF